MINHFDIRSFHEAPLDFGTIEILLTVKSFDLEAIQKRYLESRSRSRTGSVERREPAQGGVIYLILKNGKIVHQEIIARLTEPRGIGLHNQRIGLSSEDKVFLFEKDNETPTIIDHLWLSYIHTVRFNSSGNRLLVSSSGLDTIMEFDSSTGELIWDWLAWEHGINQGVNPKTNEKHILTRIPEEASLLKKQGKNPLLITNPRQQKIPTALRAAFINSAEYGQNGEILATLFHAGKVLKIFPSNSSIEVVIDGLSKPHGGMLYPNGYLVTSTGSGAVYCKGENELNIYDFSTLPSKPVALKNLEWLQFSNCLDDIVLSVDSNRHALVCVNLQTKKRMMIHYDANWAVQEFVFLNESSRDFLPRMKSWFTNHVGDL